MADRTQPSLYQKIEEPQSQLLGLPREIRDQIYSYLVTSPVQSLWPQPHDHNALGKLSSPPLSLALLRVNKQLHDEGMQALARENQWRLLSPEDIYDIFKVLGPVYVNYATRFIVTWSFLLHDRSGFRQWFDPAYEGLVIDNIIAKLPGMRKVTLDYGAMPESNGYGHVDFLKNLAHRHGKLNVVNVQRITGGIGEDRTQKMRQQDREFTEALRTIIEEREQSFGACRDSLSEKKSNPEMYCY